MAVNTGQLYQKFFAGGAGGLGAFDCNADYQEKLRQGLVFKGSAIAWSGKVSAPRTAMAATDGADAIANTLRAQWGFYNVKVWTASSMFSGSINLYCWFNSAQDHGRIDDLNGMVQSVVKGVYQNVSDVTCGVRESANPCGSILLPPGQQSPSPSPGGLPGVKNDTPFGNNIPTWAIGAGAIAIAVLFMKR